MNTISMNIGSMNTGSMNIDTMKSNESASAHGLMDSIDSTRFNAEIIAHPAQSSMGQAMAGKGQLVFEGELLEMPFSWHPSGMSH